MKVDEPPPAATSDSLSNVEDPDVLRPVLMIEYTPSKGTIAASCDGAVANGGGCNVGFQCCRASVGEFKAPWKCYPGEKAYFDINSSI